MLPFVSTGAASLPYPPFGIVGLDLAAASPLSALVVPQPAGVTTLPLAIPFLPAVVGLQLHFQAVHFRAPLPATLTNVVSDPVRR